MSSLTALLGAGRPNIVKLQEFFQNSTKHTYLKGALDNALGTAYLGLGLLGTGVAALGIKDMILGTNKTE